MGKEIKPISIYVNTYVVDHEACAVEIVVEKFGSDYYEDEMHLFTGVSKRVSPDKFDPQLGYDLAFWRAIEKAAKKELRKLNNKVKHYDDIREMQANAKPNPNLNKRKKK